MPLPASHPDILGPLFWLRDLGPAYRAGITGDPWVDLGLTLLATVGGLAIMWTLALEAAGGKEYQRLLRWLGPGARPWLLLVYGVGMGAALTGLVIPGGIALVDVVTDSILWADPATVVPPPGEGVISQAQGRPSA